jgi:hypothetical protein
MCKNWRTSQSRVMGPCPPLSRRIILVPSNHPFRRAHVTGPTTESPVARPRRRPHRIAPILILLVFIAGGLAAWCFAGRRRLEFSNELAAPIWLAVAQRAPVTLQPGTAQTVELPSGSVVVQWNLARPLSANQRPMGEELRGSAVIREKRGLIRRSATIRESGTAYFAPLITNASQELLRITTNAGLEGAVDCGCAIRPGASRVFVGYYRLYQNSTVRARDSTGRTATFRDLGPRVTAADGTVGLRFESKDFR